MLYKTTHTFKVLKSSWGIWIQITAEHRIVNSFSHDYKPVSDFIRFGFDKLQERLNEYDVKLLINGLKWIAKQIEQKFEGELIEIELIDCKFNLSDFQSEGFYYGIADWAAVHFDFKLPDYSVNFNKSENKYEFPDLYIYD
jgi:hypothetical protein